MKRNKADIEMNEDNSYEEKYTFLKKKTIKELIAPSGIDASNLNHLEIVSHTNRLARSFFVSTLPRYSKFPRFVSSKPRSIKA